MNRCIFCVLVFINAAPRALGDDIEDTRVTSKIDAASMLRSSTSTNNVDHLPLVMDAAVSTGVNSFQTQSNINFQTYFDLLNGTGSSNGTNGASGRQTFVLHEANIQSPYFLNDRLTVTFGRQLLSEGFDLALLDGAKENYHLSPKLLVTAYEGLTRYDDPDRQHNSFARVVGSRVGFFDEQNLTASVFAQARESAEDPRTNLVGTDLNRKIDWSEQTSFNLFYNVEANSTTHKLAQGTVGANALLKKALTCELTASAFDDFFDHYKQAEVIKDYFAPGRIQQVAQRSSFEVTNNVELFDSVARVKQENGSMFAVFDAGEKNTFDSAILSAFWLDCGGIRGAQNELSYVEIKALKSFVPHKFDLDARYAYDVYRKVDGIQGVAENADLGFKYYVTSQFNSRLVLAWDSNSQVRSDLYGMLYLSYSNL